jgi:uncharacterized protein with HEPN domain
MCERSLKLLVDALGAINAAHEFAADATLIQYCNNHMLRSAVERQLEILGEACSQLDKLGDQWRVQIPDLLLAIGLRNRIIHGYDTVDDEMVFETPHADLPTLSRALQAALDERTTL